MKTQVEPLSHAAFGRLLDTLREVADKHLSPEYGVVTEQDVAEGFRSALHLVSAATELYLEGDPERPEFARIVSPTRKLMGDNPDAIYHFARVRDDRAYRISGRRTDECYISFTIHGRNEEGGLGAASEPVLADVNDRGLEIDSEGRFEIVLSREERPGSWLALPASAASIIVRHYYEREDAPAAELERRVELRIEALDPVPQRPPLSDAAMAAKLEDVDAFVRGATLSSIDITKVPVPFVSLVPNELPQPSVFRTSGQDAWGAVDIAYAMCPFRLDEDEALVMEGRFPECAFANVVLWNRYMQCLEFRDRRVSLNRAQTVLDSEGRYRMVVAHRDPGVANWLDTEGHREGTVFWRFLLPEGQPEKPACRVVQLSELT